MKVGLQLSTFARRKCLKKYTRLWWLAALVARQVHVVQRGAANTDRTIPVPVNLKSHAALILFPCQLFMLQYESSWRSNRHGLCPFLVASFRGSFDDIGRCISSLKRNRGWWAMPFASTTLNLTLVSFVEVKLKGNFV